MLPDLAEIKRQRKLHNLTQSELAKLSAVSQSLIAKIESGRLDPTYTNVRKIFTVLNNLDEKGQRRASDFMVPRIIMCHSEDHLSLAVSKMRQNSISQLPIIDSGITVGLVSESTVLDALAAGKDVSKLQIKDVMADAPPVISPQTPMQIVLDLLRYSPLVLIGGSGGKFVGVLTKSDIISAKR